MITARGYEQPILTTSRLTLRPFVEADAADVSRLGGDWQIYDTTESMPHPYLQADAVDWITTHWAAWASGERVEFAICKKDGGKFIGGIGLKLNALNNRGTLGYWLGVPYWGQGYASESAGEIVRWAFDDLDLNRLEAQFLLRNPASGRIMEKLGMRQEARLESYALKHGQYEDVAQWSILKEQWLRTRVKT